MAGKSGRQSKYRHIFGEPAKLEGQYTALKAPMTSGEGQYVKANHKFFAVSKSGGGGPLYIRRLDKPGRFAADAPLLSVHKGKVLDMDFNPFVPNMIATASEDTRVNVTMFPGDGLTENVTTADVELKGHQKKVALTTFHPSAASILASGAFDRTVKVWNIEKAVAISDFKGLGDNIYSLQWNKDGSRLGVTGKDKKLRLYDPRSTEESMVEVDAFDGAKSSKMFWVPQLNWVGSCGFSKTAKRQLKLWDLAMMDGGPIFKLDIDQAASVLVPFYDDDNGVLYIAGKGDGSVQYFELVNDARKVYSLSIYRNPEPQKGGGWVGKRGLDVWKCEVARFLKLTNKAVIPVSFVVPRKAGADVFQEDIFPDCAGGKPAMAADEWEGGEDKLPLTTTLDPEQRTDDDGGAKFVKKATYAELEAENQALKARVAELEKQLGIEPEQKDDE